MCQWTVDAFTSRPFGGNPACVVEPLDRWPETDWMQALARENGAGATAFLVAGGTPGDVSIRWFTSSVEVPLCGHATLAAAHVLFDQLGTKTEVLHFNGPSGPLAVRRAEHGYEMSFPAQGAERIPVPLKLSEALGGHPSEVWAGPYLIALFDTADAILALQPDQAGLKEVSLAHGGQGNVGVAALAAGGGDFDVIDRFFAPGYGIDEDAATGSFHCVLAPIIAPRIASERIRFYQASPGRGAELTCQLEQGRVLLSGHAVMITESILLVSPRFA
jgi:PhzF family phenazine biosynthesis protein